MAFHCTWNKIQTPRPCAISPLPISPNFYLSYPPVILIFFLSLNSPGSFQSQSTSCSLSLRPFFTWLIFSCLCLQLICHFLREPFLYTTFQKGGSPLLLYLGLLVFLSIFSTKTQTARRPVPYVLITIISLVPDTVPGSQYMPNEYLLSSLIYGATVYANFNSIIKFIINIFFLDNFWK